MSAPLTPTAVTVYDKRIGNLLEVQFDDVNTVDSFIVTRKVADTEYEYYDELNKSDLYVKSVAGTTYQAYIYVKSPFQSFVNYYEIYAKNSDGISSASPASTNTATYGCLDIKPLLLSRRRSSQGNTQILQYEYGNEERRAVWRNVRYEFEVTYDTSKVTEDELNQFYNNMLGDFGTFYLPTYLNEATLSADIIVGQQTFTVSDVSWFSPNLNEWGNNIYIEDGSKAEVLRVSSIDYVNSTITTDPIVFAHSAGTTVHVALKVKFNGTLDETIIKEYRDRVTVRFRQVFEVE